MSAVEDTRKVAQDFLGPYLQSVSARLDALEKQLADKGFPIVPQVVDLNSIEERLTRLEARQSAHPKQRPATLGTMPARLRYPDLAPDGYAALSAFGHYVNTGTALEPGLLALVNLRASLLNGCAFCIGMHTAELRKLHEPQSRIDAVAAGSTSSAFTPREQAALRWTEVLTRLEGSRASDEDYAAVTAFFQGKDVVDLSFAIAGINAWNRMGLAFRPEWRPPAAHGDSDAAGRSSSAPPAPASSGEAESAAVGDDGGKVALD